MLTRISIVLITLGCMQISQSAKRAVGLKLYNFTCTPYSNLIVDYACTLKKWSNTEYAYSTMFKLRHQLSKNAEVEILLDAKPSTGKNLMKLIRIRISICEALNQMFSNPILKTLMIELFRTTNLPYACPINGNYMYNATDCIISDDLVPSYLVNLQFNFTVNFLENRRRFVELLIRGATVRKK
ncbi:uncharacterized protein LOC131995331 [Stomoxys calcitrans]|uniref:uncharacterized protein LOC131995331 n=1 Tax=Stomoxys calcitrans TaxID=35570 RepID=UPI0027E3B078|nr:uncharacterized protein LOC131995331 [Stomoxys calcitrans]